MSHAGAIASNAGDDFHFIWAGKKIIKMLELNSNLTAVTVEGPASEDSVRIQDQSKLYSIDMTEYYGGKDFQCADKVIFTQLKYSAYQPEKDWNTTRLCTSSDTQKSNSVIRRMADTYMGYAEAYGDISDKIILKLVSNQNLSENLISSFEKSTAILEKFHYKNTDLLLKKLNARQRETIEKIYRISRLSSRRFIQFLKAVDFESCGTSVRQIHEIEILQKLRIWGFDNVKSTYADLIEAIRRCMLPEGKDTCIDAEWVKNILCTEEHKIFPAPARFLPFIENYIVKKGEQQLAVDLARSEKKWVCLHATAGAGKTTFVNKLKRYFPEDSAVVIYDCYGGGAYLQPDQPRHTKELAIRQICNMLALECGTEFLLGVPHLEYNWWEAIKDRIEKASAITENKNPRAIVAIVIDAADNSMYAESVLGNVCFLKTFFGTGISFKC